MPTARTLKRPELIADNPDEHLAAFARDVAAGLTAHPKCLSCCYFYDHQGSLLFEEICQLEEYYLTRAEREILLARAAEIAALFPGEIALVELGSGSATKTRILIEAFLRQRGALRYVPVDISRTMLEESTLALRDEYPELEIVAVAAEYTQGLRHLAAESARPKLVLWLGSNIGNFDRPEAARFLRQVRETMAPCDRLLVGVDLRKEAVVLERAYDDARGVTAQFNLNLLARINREMGGHFDLAMFRHRALYDEEMGRVEMYLDSLVDQQVRIDRLGLEVSFAAGEPIHTENSYKYSGEEIQALARSAGVRIERQWFDGARRFSVNLLAPE
ncbi:MAG: L-histidine N(alpha)-methyltransferase [Armatimonadetes bacterium]|nr:L-histidine N(alpha)-methyltransferase [Armatimonadota bacterium]